MTEDSQRGEKAVASCTGTNIRCRLFRTQPHSYELRKTGSCAVDVSAIVSV